MQRLYAAMRDALRRGESLSLCCVISGPSAVLGAKLAVFSDGSMLGALPAGAAEVCLPAAHVAIAQRRSQLAEFSAGNMTALCAVQFLPGRHARTITMLDYLAFLLMQRADNHWLVMEIGLPERMQLGLYTPPSGLRFGASAPPETLLPLLHTEPVFRSGSPGYYVEPLLYSPPVQECVSVR